MNVSDILDAAADHIERHGHHKGSGFASSPPTTSAACSIGAITLASADGSTDGLAVRGLSLAAQEALRDYTGSFIIDWNDAPERTAGEVVEALRAAAVIEAAKEQAPVSSVAVSAS